MLEALSSQAREAYIQALRSSDEEDRVVRFVASHFKFSWPKVAWGKFTERSKALEKQRETWSSN
jgi:hypothetical protein